MAPSTTASRVAPSPREGATVDTIEVVKDGLVGRGVLLDVPRVRGVAWLEPGEHIFPEDLERAEREQGVTVGRGRHPPRPNRPRSPLGRARSRGTRRTPRRACTRRAALFLAERRIAALGSDGNSDTAPSTTEGIDFPIHALTLNAMGVHLLDYLQFEDLGPPASGPDAGSSCSSARPLRIAGGTGSPLNPIAVL